MIFSVDFRHFFINFRPILEKSLFDPFCRHFACGTSWGWNFNKIDHFWPPKSTFCYIVVSTFFGPSGPPPVLRFWTIFWPEHSLFVGNGSFYRVDFGGRKVESFCKKVENFKKFMILGSRTPGVDFCRFWSFLTPPWQINFWALLGHFMSGQFFTFFDHFWPPILTIYNRSILTIF
jgi:hypothetical protein